MTNHRRRKLDRVLSGVQLAIFEVVWAAFPWMKAVWLKKGGHFIHFFVKVASSPEAQARQDCDRLLGEVVEAAAKFHASLGGGHRIRYGFLVPRHEGFMPLMSDRMFRAIARRHAPWRLHRGR